MPKYRFNLRTSKATTQDVPCLVRFIIRWNGHTLTYPTGETIAPKYWQDEPGQRNFQRAKESKSFPEFPEFNRRLSDLELKARDTFRAFTTDHGRDPFPDELRTALDVATGRTVETPAELFAFAAGYMDSEEGRFNPDRKRSFHRATTSRYRVTLAYLKEYTAQRQGGKGGRVPFAAITPDYVTGFTAFLTNDKGFAAHTVVKYARTLRLFMTKAEERGHEVNRQAMAKATANIQLGDETDMVYLTTDELMAFDRADLSAHPRLDAARDRFIVQAFTGLRFGDLSRLTPEHFAAGQMETDTSKTGKRVVAPIAPVVQRILSKYGGKMPPAISNQKQNDYLKAGAELVPELQERVRTARTVAGLRVETVRRKCELITTHTARRSFASNLYLSGVPARSIMKVTGHTTEQAFMRYIRLTDTEHLGIIAASPMFSAGTLKVA